MITAKAQGIVPKIDEKVELMSILAKLAGYEEYNMNQGGDYIADIDDWFKDCVNHPAVQQMREYRSNEGVAYDAVMSMAIHIEKKEGRFALRDGAESALDGRWKNIDKVQFIDLLNQFYLDSKFESFFNDHQPFYGQVLSQYNENVMKYFDESWFSKFYGTEPREKYSVIIGCANGSASYGPSRMVNGQKEVFAIIGYFVYNGELMFNKGYSATLIHEFNHSFVNHLLYKSGNYEALKEAGTELFQLCGWSMMNQAYSGWGTVINESIVRAAVICYMLDKGYSKDEIKAELQHQMQRNFHWIPELVILLRKYEKKQEKYGALENFYPHIISFFDDYVEKENKRLDAVK